MSGGYNEIGTHEMDPMIERVLLLKQEAFVYKIPPAQVSKFILCKFFAFFFFAKKRRKS